MLLEEAEEEMQSEEDPPAKRQGVTTPQLCSFMTLMG